MSPTAPSAVRRAFRIGLSSGGLLLSTLTLAARPATASNVPPYSPLWGALRNIAEERQVPLEVVLQDPERWLRGAAEGVRPGRHAPEVRVPATITTSPDPAVRFTFPERVGEGLSGPIAGDFDGNGIDDVVARTAAGSAVIFEGDAFHPLESQRAVSLATGDELRAAADMNLDGRCDLITTRASDQSVAVYGSLGSGGFSLLARLAVGTPAEVVTAGDLDGDSRPDLVLGPALVTVLNRPGVTLELGASPAAAPFLGAPVTADFDEDGRPDIAVMTESYSGPGGWSSTITLFRNSSDHQLDAWTSRPDLGGARMLGTGDLDGDGNADLIRYQAEGDSLLVLSGRGDGTFRAHPERSLESYGHGACIAVADFDRDGLLDVLARTRTPGCFSSRCSRLSLLPGLGAGGLAPAIEFMAEPGNDSDAGGLAIGDFNGDDAPDAASVVGGAQGSPLFVVFNDRLGGFDSPVTLRVAQSPGVLVSLRGNPAGTTRICGVAGDSAWISSPVGPRGFSARTLIGTGAPADARDLNGDQVEDLLLVRGSDVDVLLANGAGGFSTTTYSGGEFLACADFDGANGADLALKDAAGGEVRVRFNDGSGHFGAATDFGISVADGVWSVGAADLDRDGRADFLLGVRAVYPGLAHSLEIHWNLGGSFGPAQVLPFGSSFQEQQGFNPTYPASILRGDFDGNGWPDVAVVDAAGSDHLGGVSVLLNGGSRAFLPAADYGVGKDPHMGVVADFDRDGLDDLAVACDQDNEDGALRVLRADFGGVMSQVNPRGWPSLGYTADHWTYGVGLGDWDGDGRADLVASSSFFQSSVTFFRNRSALGLPTAAALALVHLIAGRDGVHLEWLAPSAGFSATLERSTDGAEWTSLGGVAADGTGRLACHDATASPGSRVGYRLAWGAAGAVHRTEEAWIDVPGPPTLALAMRGARPNPVRGTPVLSFTLPSGAAATLELYDVSGRRVSSESIASPTAGEHAYRLRGERALDPGMYLARLTQAGRSTTARFVVLP